jgi:hypothetical protein
MTLRDLGREKGDRSNLPERPGGCFAQIGPVPFFPLTTPLDEAAPTTPPVQACSGGDNTMRRGRDLGP